MPVNIDGTTYFSIGEALESAGVSRSTYFRWVRRGKIADASYRDRNGHRVFTQEELGKLQRLSGQLSQVNPHQLSFPIRFS